MCDNPVGHTLGFGSMSSAALHWFHPLPSSTQWPNYFLPCWEVGPGTAGIREARPIGARLRISMSCTKRLQAQAVSHTQLGASTHGCPGMWQVCSSHISNHWSQHPLHQAVISGWPAQPLLDLFVCLLHTLFVCCLPAELFSACIQSVGWPALLLDGLSLTCKPAEAAWFSWQIPSITRIIPRC